MERNHVGSNDHSIENHSESPEKVENGPDPNGVYIFLFLFDFSYYYYYYRLRIDCIGMILTLRLISDQIITLSRNHETPKSHDHFIIL